jgi:hypothetical protein
MKTIKIVLVILLATTWISISEFVRNEFLLKSFWINHYHDLGLTFPSERVNGAIWGVWSMLLAILIFIIAKRFSVIQTTFIVWLAGFVMMWVVTGNLGVLPSGLLLYAIPLSILESFVASFIIIKLH